MSGENSRRKKTAAVTVISAVAITALVGGTLAQFTDSDTTTPQMLKAGTVEIDLVEGAGWNTSLTNLAVGDTADRTVLVDNTSSLAIGAMRLTADLTDTTGEFGGKLSEAVTVDITQDNTVVLANDVRLADLTDGYDLTFAIGVLPASADVDLGFHYEVVGAPTDQTGDRTKGQRDLPINPDNKYQGSALSVTYTIDAIQRGGIADERDPVAPTDATATVTGTSATIAFTAPATNPDGTVYTATAIEDGTVTGASADVASVLPLGEGEPTVLSVAADTLAPARIQASALSSPITVTGLEHSTTYTFAVTATGPTGTTTEAVYSNPITTEPPVTTGTLSAWGQNNYGQATIPTGLGSVRAMSAGQYHNVAVKPDGTVVAWGSNNYGQTNVPAGLTGVIDVAGGHNHSLALKADGTVVAWPVKTDWSQTIVPAGLSNVKQIGAGQSHSVALKKDGTVVAWGSGNMGAAPAPAGLTDITQIAVGGNHNLALRSDGTVTGWGYNYYGQATPPAGLTNVVAIAAGTNHSMALKADGTVVSWGWNNTGQATVPAGLTNVAAIAAGALHSVVVKSDGTVVAWGNNGSGQTTVPATVTNPLLIEAGYNHTLALLSTP